MYSTLLNQNGYDTFFVYLLPTSNLRTHQYYGSYGRYFGRIDMLFGNQSTDFI